MDVAIEEAPGVEEYERIFERYLDVCNQALQKNKGKFPYTEVWKTRWKELGQNNTLQCAVYDDRPKIIYTLKLTKEMQIKIVEKTQAVPGDAWPFKYSYLRQVVENPADYIDHPANLDWGWLTPIFG